ncbi:MAG: hypothetical protein ACYDA0_15665, partial [Candidatus Dormibacteraceae bacterium]
SGHWRESRGPAPAIAERIGDGAMEPDIAIPRGLLVRLERARWLTGTLIHPMPSAHPAVGRGPV